MRLGQRTPEKEIGQNSSKIDYQIIEMKKSIYQYPKVRSDKDER